MAENPPLTVAKDPTLADFTNETLIIPRLAARDMVGVIEELSRAFPRCDSRWDANVLIKLALEREKEISTAMDFGAAFPHVRSPTCLRLQFAMGCTATPITWGPPGAPSVQVIFLNAVPEHDAMGYLKLLSGLARLGQDPSLLAQFIQATTVRELLDLLARAPVRK